MSIKEYKVTNSEITVQYFRTGRHLLQESLVSLCLALIWGQRMGASTDFPTSRPDTELCHGRSTEQQTPSGACACSAAHRLGDSVEGGLHLLPMELVYCGALPLCLCLPFDFLTLSAQRV